MTLLGPTLAVLLGIANGRTAFASFADPIIFLFIGSFILAVSEAASNTAAATTSRGWVVR